MPKTALRHFQEDISRARAILDFAQNVAANTPQMTIMRDDLYRCSWMFAVGAVDAYFSDAYTHCVASVLRAKNIQKNRPVNLPQQIELLKVPVSHILKSYAVKHNWKWRMAVRKLMVRESVLSLERARDLLNPYLVQSHKIFANPHIDSMIQMYSSAKRLFGISRRNFGLLQGYSRTTAIKSARDKFFGRFHNLIQRRHDCIHDCDRPRTALQRIGRSGTVRNVIADIDFVVVKVDSQIDGGFRAFLRSIGCTPKTLNSLGL